MIDRRRFVKGTMAGAAALALGGRAAAREPKLKILVLGGTMFLGPAVVEAAVARGHAITLFNRGKTRPELFPDVEKLHGDRNGDLKALEGRSWDAVVDTSANIPRWVDSVAAVLKEKVDRYVYISSVSVYPDMGDKDTDESSPVGTMKDPTVEEMGKGFENYGPLKALCEAAAEKHWPGRTTNIRPGLIVGPLDPSDRFTYWPVRVKRGGEVLAPGAPGHGVQYIDVRDLGAWIVHCIEAKVSGVFNALGPDEPTPMGDLLEACKKASGSDATFTWADAATLQEHRVSAWSDMPVWLPPPEGMDRPAMCSNAKALAQGLKFRPLATTVADTLKWAESRPADRKFRSGIKPEREQEVLEALKAARKGGGGR